MTKPFLIAVPALVLAACSHGGHHGHHHGPMMHTPAEAQVAQEKTLGTASATIVGAAGTPIGTARFEQGTVGLMIRMELEPGALTPGWHGVHLHETGDCSDVGTFQLSGGHHGREEGAHGLLNPDKGPEPGDLPNAWAAVDGSVGYEAFTLLTDLMPALGGDGLSIIVHANEDDHRSQPVGGAGARVACGVVVRMSP